ncbi:GAF domain-containing protein [Actinoplanes friuliensis]|uniref:ANTAR domain-containing protein n=1 Tax=Actinoplanes friuliensis DSM 7358 TaxID=1246995 RepID=U5W5D5_9ACTN|nr:GAF domain-containing protein [Actinoplanes friuliensis]AGZ43121.1 ANTAR domain-containing protein [Actinoplanes friuliensis DSM 7358]
MTAAHGALTAAMIAVAGTPERSPDLDGRLLTIAKLTADRVGAARYASITALLGGHHTTVAVSDELIRAVDEAQYADDAGPCLESLSRGTPIGVPAIDTMVQWPKFHEMAPRMGLVASVSVPLFAGRGEPIAVLNIYGTDHAAMAPLIAGIWAVHGDPARTTLDEALAGLDDGGRELVSGYAEALAVRATIRLAIELIRSENHCGPEDAYLSLCIRAAGTGSTLAETAADLIGRGP